MFFLSTMIIYVLCILYFSLYSKFILQIRAKTKWAYHLSHMLLSVYKVALLLFLIYASLLICPWIWCVGKTTLWNPKASLMEELQGTNRVIWKIHPNAKQQCLSKIEIIKFFTFVFEDILSYLFCQKSSNKVLQLIKSKLWNTQSMYLI